MKVTAIVPALNEEKTIEEVVRILRSSLLVQEVIVVSDGSTDATAVRATEAGARVLALPKRGGKGPAMMHGLMQTDAPIILFADADLRGFTVEHIEALLLPVLSGSRTMNIGLRDRGWLFTRLSAYLPLISGERALKREVLEHIPAQFLKGFMVESAMNYWCRIRKESYGSVPLGGLSIRRKYEKVGWFKGLQEYIKMSLQISWGIFKVRFAHLFGKYEIKR